MSNLLFYILSTGVCLTLFISTYQIFLRNNTRFNLCRFYLIASILLSFLIPSLPIDLGIKPLFTRESNKVILTNIESIDTGSVETLKDVSFVSSAQSWDIDPIKTAGIVLLSISLLLFIRFIYRFGSIILIQTSGSRLESEKGLNLIFTDKTDNAFSFLGYIFINPLKFTDEEKRLIIEHEREHIRHLHSIDLILIELLIVIQWFNPFAYIARRKLIEIHEFIADNGVIRNGADPYSYQNLLLSVVTSSCLPMAGNQLSAFITKKRIAMIGKPMNQTGRWISFLILIPIAAILIIGVSAFSPKESKILKLNQTDTTSHQILQERSFKEVTNGVLQYLFVDLTSKNSNAYSVTLQQGQLYTIYYYSNSYNDRLYAKVESAEIEKDLYFSYTGKIGFTPKKTGTYHLIIENLSSNKTNALMVLTLEEPKVVETQKPDDDQSFTVVEQMPTFGRGDADEFRSWVLKNMQYPKEAAEKGIQGRVFIQYVVEKDGSITNVKVLRGIDPSLDKEAIRVMEASPKWNPGKQRGTAVRVLYTFPITFSLNTKKGQIQEIPKSDTLKDKIVEEKDIEKEEVFLVVEQMPTFGSGDANEFRSWLFANMKYPEDAAKKGIQGRVFVQFVVEKDGSITNAKVLRGVDPTLDKEAIRVVEASPKWNPGLQRGKPVRVSYTFPITFTLDNNNDSKQIQNETQSKEESKNKNELSARAENEVKNTYLKDFYSELSVNGSQSFSVILKKDITYKLYLLSSNKNDKLLAKIESKNADGTMVTEKEKGFSYSSNFAFSPEKTGAYSLIVSNSSTQKAEALMVLTMAENNIK